MICWYCDHEVDDHPYELACEVDDCDCFVFEDEDDQ